MTRSEKLSPVLKLTLSRKRKAEIAAARASHLLREYEMKLEELRQYRSEYAIVNTSGGQVLSASHLQERQKFIRQLDEGIKILKNKVKGQQEITDVDKQAWLEAHKHNDAIDKLMGKMRKLEWQLRETREDNAMDDRAQRTRNPFQDKTA